MLNNVGVRVVGLNNYVVIYSAIESREKTASGCKDRSTAHRGAEYMAVSSTGIYKPHGNYILNGRSYSSYIDCRQSVVYNNRIGSCDT